MGGDEGGVEMVEGEEDGGGVNGKKGVLEMMVKGEEWCGHLGGRGNRTGAHAPTWWRSIDVRTGEEVRAAYVELQSII